jgi:uncharacterized delta-60 repeat protein
MTCALRARAWTNIGLLASLSLNLATACGDVNRRPAGDDGDGDEDDGDDDGSASDAGLAEGFSLALGGDRIMVRQGASANVGATVERAPDFDGSILLTVLDLPEGVTADPVTVAAGETETILSLSADSNAAQGALPIEVSASAGDLTRTRTLRLLVAGQPGTLDRSFADAGRFSTRIGNMTTVGRGLVLQPGPAGDRFLVTGATGTQAVTIRLDDTGALDDTFGSGGAVSTGIGPSSGGIVVKLAASGRILVGGWGGTDGVGGYNSALFAYTADGVLDTAFGDGGTAVVSLGSGMDEIHQVLEDEEGRLYTFTTSYGSPVTAIMARFSGEGDRDPGFGAVVENAFVETAIFRDGNVIMAGLIIAPKGSSFWLARRRPDGSADTTFDGDGHAVTGFGDTSSGRVSGVIPAAEEKLLAIGVVNLNPEDRFLTLTRYNSNGSLDLTFGNGGIIRTTTPFATGAPNAAIVDLDGRILFAGTLPDASTAILAVARCQPDGTLDPAFGESGIATADFNVPTISSDGAFGVTLDSDGRIILSGGVGPAGDQELAVARFWP